MSWTYSCTFQDTEQIVSIVGKTILHVPNRPVQSNVLEGGFEGQ